MTSGLPTCIKLGNLVSQVISKLPEGAKSRNVYELSNPTTQCNRTILTFEQQKDKTCYICGLEIKPDSTEEGFRPECEHLLPIAQAVLFLGLYHTGINYKQSFCNPDILKLEYRWAHGCCNQIKSDSSYIKYTKSKNVKSRYEVDTDGLNNLLIKIWNNNRSDSILFKNELHMEYNNDVSDFIKERIDEVKKPFIKIVTFLNNYEAPEFLFLLGAVKALEGPMAPWAKELVGTANLEKQREIISEEEYKQFKNKYIATLTKFINDNLKNWTTVEKNELKTQSMSENVIYYYYTLYNTLSSEDKTKFFSIYIPIVFRSNFYNIIVSVQSLLKLYKNTSERAKRTTSAEVKKIRTLTEEVEKGLENETYKEITKAKEKFNANVEKNIQNVAEALTKLGQNNNKKNRVNMNTRKNNLKRRRNNMNNYNNYNNNQNENNYNNYEYEERNIIFEPSNTKRPRFGGRKTHKRRPKRT
jgi:hypothetical protein